MMLETRSTGHLRNEQGSIALVLVLTIPLVIALVLYVTHLYQALERRAHLQDMADAAALQAADSQARLVNMTAMTNHALLATMSLAGGTFLVGHATALVLDALVVTAPAGVALHGKTTVAVEKLRGAARTIAEVQEGADEYGRYLPLLAAQTPALLNKGDPAVLVLPYPLPGVNQSLTLGLPVDQRGFAVTDFITAVTSFLTDAMEDSISNITEYAGANKLNEKMAGLCNDFDEEDQLRAARQKASEDGETMRQANVRASQAKNQMSILGRLGPLLTVAPLQSIKPAFRGTCAELEGDDKSLDLGTLVSKKLGSKLSSIMRLAGDGWTIRKESVAGFPMPLLLEDDYPQRFQVGVIAVSCKPSGNHTPCAMSDIMRSFQGGGTPYMAISQARARSLTQNRGGGLFIPDFRPRLVPVAMDGGGGEEDQDSSAGSLLKDSPWDVLH